MLVRLIRLANGIRRATITRIRQCVIEDSALATFRLTHFMRFVLLGLFTLSYPVMLRAQEQVSLGIMPVPANVTQGEGRFVIDGSFGIALEGFQEARLERARQRFLDVLSRETGIPL